MAVRNLIFKKTTDYLSKSIDLEEAMLADIVQRVPQAILRHQESRAAGKIILRITEYILHVYAL